MINWLKENHGNRVSTHANERFELDYLRKEVDRLRESTGQAFDGDNESGHGSELESASEEEDYIDELPLPVANKAKGPRSSVSAEAYGKWNKKGDFKPMVIPKSQEVKDQMRIRLNQAFMFSALNDTEF